MVSLGGEANFEVIAPKLRRTLRVYSCTEHENPFNKLGLC